MSSTTTDLTHQEEPSFFYLKVLPREWGPLNASWNQFPPTGFCRSTKWQIEAKSDARHDREMRKQRGAEGKQLKCQITDQLQPQWLLFWLPRLRHGGRDDATAMADETPLGTSLYLAMFAHYEPHLLLVK